MDGVAMPPSASFEGRRICEQVTVISPWLMTTTPRASRWRSCWVVTGNQVVDYALAHEFLQGGDLNRVSGLILDHHMAHVTGLELAARLRAGGWQLPVLLLVTGAPSPAIAARAAEFGVTKGPEKPSAEADIMAIIGGLGGCK
jgi:CheY-like chemotaxis protein